MDIVEIADVELSSVNFTYTAGEDINTVWNGKYHTKLPPPQEHSGSTPPEIQIVIPVH